MMEQVLEPISDSEEGSIIANTNMQQYFDGFPNCITMDLSYLNTSLTTDMSSMFGSVGSAVLGTGNKLLNNIIFSDYFDTSNVTNMSMMFSYCRYLNNLDVSSFNTNKVTIMSQMFYGCRSLTDLDLSNFDTSNVTSMSQMFQHCENLTHLDLTSFDTSKVTSYNTMFNDMANITEILVTRDTWTIPNSTIADSGVTDFTYV